MSSYFKLLKSVGSDVLYPAFGDFMRSLPDSLLIGSSIFALMTQSFPIGILVLAVAELSLGHKLLGGFVKSVQGGNTHIPDKDACRPGLPSPYQISLVGKLLGETTFPSGPIFLVCGTIAYILASSVNFQKELEELGKKEPEWKARLPLSFTFGLLFMILFVIWRVSNECDGVVTALGSTVIGLLFGGIIYLVHVYLFGRDAVNFLGVPLLADKAAGGRPLYACAKQTAASN
jgi:hypothetical protein